MKRVLAFLFLLSLVTFATLSPEESARASGTSRRHATKILVSKSGHEMKLFDGTELLGTYTVSIGPGGTGPKLREGDRVTPVGNYHVTWKGPSRFGTFMLLDYPNADDRARFARLKAAGAIAKSARIGGDVGIHGGGPVYAKGDEIQDWTLGCVAVDDEQIKEVAPMVAPGTLVVIED
jgi:murein L,D-transpeptidase YafK